MIFFMSALILTASHCHLSHLLASWAVNHVLIEVSETGPSEVYSRAHNGMEDGRHDCEEHVATMAKALHEGIASGAAL